MEKSFEGSVVVHKDSLEELGQLLKDLPSELLSRVFYEAGFPIEFSVVCRYWHQIFMSSVCLRRTPKCVRSCWALYDMRRNSQRHKRKILRLRVLAFIDGLSLFMNQYNRKPTSVFETAESAQTIFELAALFGESSLVKMLLDDPRVDPGGKSKALQWACYYKNIECVQLLLLRVAPTSEAIFEAFTHGGNPEIVCMLYSHPSVDTSMIADSDALCLAIVHNNIRAFKTLLALPFVNPAKDSLTITTAIKYGRSKFVKLLLKDQRVDPCVNHNEPLREAASTGLSDIVEILLLDGRVNPADFDNHAIRIAARKGHTDVIRLLLKDPRVDPAVDDFAPIRAASSRGYCDILKMLLADPRVNFTTAAEKAMKLACQWNCPEVLKLLLQDKRVDPSIDSNASIRLASEWGCVDIIRLLLSHPAVDPSVQDNICLKVSCARGHVDVVFLLLEHPRVRVTTGEWERQDIINKITSSMASVKSSMSASPRYTHNLPWYLPSSPRYSPLY